MQERSPMDVAIMKQIVRQKDLQLRGAVHDIIDNRIDAALQRIETQPADRARSASASLPGSAIQETETPVNDIVADWTDRTPEARSRTLIITQLNADRRAVNAGIHAVLAARGELGEKAITVPVLDKITHTRHEFNKTDAWEAGMVVKRGDRYQDVLAVDRNGSTVTVRDEEGRLTVFPEGTHHRRRAAVSPQREGSPCRRSAEVHGDRQGAGTDGQPALYGGVGQRNGQYSSEGENGRVPSILRRSGRSSILTTAGPSQGTVLRGPVATMSLRLRARKAGLPSRLLHLGLARERARPDLYRREGGLG
jgi:hypothetical protein